MSFPSGGSGFANPPVANPGIISRPVFKSDNYVAGVSGWAIFRTGNAEFNDLSIRGTFTGTDFIINAEGIFLYSGAPANGNLIGYWTNSAGTDAYNNAYTAGLSVGGPTVPNILLTQDGNGAYLQLPTNTNDSATVQVGEILSYIFNQAAVNQQLALIINGPANDSINATTNYFSIEMLSDSDDGSLSASLQLFDSFRTPFITMKNSNGLAPQMFIGQSASGSSTFIPINLNGAFVTYSQNAGGQVTETFTRTTTWTCPTGVTSVKAEAWGAGGGGQYASGAGGAGGEYAVEPALAVTPDHVYTITVGAGGAPGTSANGPGSPGGNSVFAGDVVTVTAHGGLGSSSNLTPGASGSANTTHFNGGRALVNTSGPNNGGGGGGSSGCPTAAGRDGQSNSGSTPGNGGIAAGMDSGVGGGGGWGSSSPTSGGNGATPAGGGGTGGASSNAGKQGGPGGNGQIRLTYTLPGSTSIQASLSSTAGTDPLGNQYPAGYQGQTVAVQPSSSPSVPETWHQATLLNGWAGSGNGVNGLFYRLTSNNEVEIMADINSPGTASTIATLPLGYRPSGSGGINIPLHRYDDAGEAHANVSSAGAILMQTVVGSGKSLFINARVPLGTI